MVFVHFQYHFHKFQSFHTFMKMGTAVNNSSFYPCLWAGRMTIYLTKWDIITSNQYIVPLQKVLFVNWWYWDIRTIRRQVVAWNIDDSWLCFPIRLDASSEKFELRLQRYSSTDYCQSHAIWEVMGSDDNWLIIMFFNSNGCIWEATRTLFAIVSQHWQPEKPPDLVGCSRVRLFCK